MATLEKGCVSLSIVVNAPDWWVDDDFFAYAQRKNVYSVVNPDDRLDEWNSIIVLVEPNLEGEGSDDEMPFWSDLIELLKSSEHSSFFTSAVAHLSVRITNLDE